MSSYEYKFVRLGIGLFSADDGKNQYQAVIHKHAEEGWRLVQVFAPSIASAGSAKYFEIILEREREPGP